ncbi:MAG: CvpA family protein [Solirubrobacteraceae bacterium]
MNELLRTRQRIITGIVVLPRVPIVDLIIVALTLAVSVWGYRRGVRTGLLVLVGFGGGALLGSRLAPLLLDGGLDDPYAPVVGLPAALLFGAAGAAVLERVGLRLRRGLRDRSRLDAGAGAVLTGLFGLVLVWILAATIARVDGLRGSIRDSAIIDGLNAVVPPPGPLLNARAPASAPALSGPEAYGRPPGVNVKRDAEVIEAKASVAKISVSGCRGIGGGSGWIAADGIVVTNAHVTEGAESIGVQLEGEGPYHAAESIWYDALNDIAILRTPGVRGVPPLEIVAEPKPGTRSAILGFPGGGPYVVKPARLGVTSTPPVFRVQGGPRGRRLVTRMIARATPGNSGGPVVDLEGRVVGMTFASSSIGYSASAVPTVSVKRALRKAGPAVKPGPCEQ